MSRIKNLHSLFRSTLTMPYNDRIPEITPVLNKEKKASHGIFNRAIPIHRTRVERAVPLHKPAENVQVWEILVPIAPNINIPSQIYIPKNKISQKCHTVFYIPGTAFVASESDFTHMLCSHLCEQTQQQIIVIHPRLAPENKFPIGQDDCFLAFKALIQTKMANIDIKQITLAGYCSGGNFAIQMALLAREEGLLIKHLLLISPFVDLSRSHNDYKIIENQDETISEEFAAWCAKMYVPSNISSQDPAISPLLNLAGHFKKIATSIDIIVSNRDRFFGDSMQLYYLFKKADLIVDLELIEGDHSYAWHDKALIEAMAKTILTVASFSNKKLKPSFPECLDTSLSPHQAPHSAFFEYGASLRNESTRILEISPSNPRKIIAKL